MSLTPQQWLNRPGMFRCILVEADYLEGGQLKTLYLSNYAYRSSPTDNAPNRVYKNWINKSSTLTFAQRMSVVLYGYTQTSTGAIEVFLHPSIEQLITDADFEGQALRVFVGSPSWSRDDFIPKFVGQGKSFDPVDNKRARITFTDKSQSLKKGVLTSLIATGSNAGDFKPKCLGQCFNIEPKLLNEVTNTYSVNDGPIEAVTAVREGGFVISPTSYSVDINNGTVTINKNVTGRITMDVQGHKESGIYLTTAEQIINYLLSIAGQSASVDTNILPSYLLGVYVREQRDIDSIIDETCLSVGGNWTYDELSQFRLMHYNGTGTVSKTIKRGQIEHGSLRIKTRLPAVKQLSVHYQRNWTEQTEGLATSITENNPELAALYRNQYSSTTDTQTVANPSAAASLELNTLIVTKADADTELARRLALKQNPKAIFEAKTILKTHTEGETASVHYSRYFNPARDAVLVGQVHRINEATDIIEVLA